ncbi:unnamed protein product, partial [Coregonus sp. 'balchen']
EGDNLIFRNEITSFDDSSDIITRRHKVEIKFSCIYSKRGKVSLEFLANKILYIFREKGFGKFTYQFEFFHSSRFNTMVDPDSYPVEVDLKELVYMEITSLTSVPNTEICKKDKTVQIYSSSQSQFHFAMEAFKFIGMHDQVNAVYISCAVILCEAENPNTRCAQGCVNGIHRHGRGAFQQTATMLHHSPTALPILFEATDVALNLNLVFIVGCLLAAVAVVCGVVIYRSMESKVKYQLLPTDK